MATTPTVSNDSHTIGRIDSVIDAHEDLCPHRRDVRISIEKTQIMLRGCLPTNELKDELVLAIRQAGVLGQICNCIQVG